MVFPQFDKDACYQFFKNCFSRSKINRFNIPPAWTPQYDNPEKSFNLQPPCYKYTSFIRNRIFVCLKANDYIECRVQKGFIPEIRGTTNTHSSLHTSYGTPKETKNISSDIVGPENAFGDVSHSLIPTVLQFHQIPREMQNIISELYSGFLTSIVTKTFVTSLLQVEKGVLQGDCLSLLLNHAF